MQILDLEDSSNAEAWIDSLIAGGFQDVIWLTGEGLRRLLTIARRTERETAFIAALGNVRSITRGPKPARALAEIGLAPGLAAAIPTSEGVAVAPGAGRHHGTADRRSALSRRRPSSLARDFAGTRGGADPGHAVPLCLAGGNHAGRRRNRRHARRTHRCHRLHQHAAGGTLFDVAEKAGIGPKLKEAFGRVSVASIGPIVEEALHRHGVSQMVQPETAFHMKPLLRTIAAWSAARG